MARKSESNPYENVINMKKVPILPLDNRWHQLFPNNSKPQKIKRLEQDVLNHIKKENSVSQDLKKLHKIKKKLMSEIVQNMEETNSEDEKKRQKKLEASQKLIMDINKKITDLENEKYQLPYDLLKANERLLLESIDICYNKIKNNESQIDYLSEWIDKTRIELKKNVIIKQEKEETNANIYAYMHDMLGPEFMEIFDKGHAFSMKHDADNE